MGAKLGSSKGAVSDINMTPLIDIVLVVLIIMMVNMPIQIEEMGVKLPGQKTTQTQPDTKVEQLVIALYDDGKLALNRTLITEEVLFHEVSRRLRSMVKKNVFVDAGASVAYGRVVHMVDLAREAGAAQVGLARMKEEGPLEATAVHPGTMERGVSLGSPRVVGKISEKKADEAFQPLMGSVRACYNQALARSPQLSGRLLVTTTIGPEGEHLEPPATASGSTVSEPGLVDCITELLPAVKYEPLGEGNTARVQYALLFSPG